MKQVQDAEQALYRESTLWPLLPSAKCRSLQDIHMRARSCQTSFPLEAEYNIDLWKTAQTVFCCYLLSPDLKVIQADSVP